MTEAGPPTSRPEQLCAAPEQSVDVEPGRDPLRANPLRLRQILVILLDSAVKFTPSGGSVALDVAGERCAP
jgi:signal transduction histidine kinase